MILVLNYINYIGDHNFFGDLLILFREPKLKASTEKESVFTLLCTKFAVSLYYKLYCYDIKALLIWWEKNSLELTIQWCSRYINHLNSLFPFYIWYKKNINWKAEIYWYMGVLLTYLSIKSIVFEGSLELFEGYM